MQRVILAMVVLVVFFATLTDAQVPTPAKCELGIADAPAIRGVKLGMTSEQVLDILGAGLPVTKGEYGFLTSQLKSSPYFRDKYNANDPLLFSMLRELAHVETVVEKIPVLMIDLNFTQIASSKDFEQMQPKPQSLKGVVNFQIDLRDDKVTAIYFLFDSTELDGLDDAGRIAKLSEMLGLPEKSWVTGASHHTIACGNEFYLASHKAKGTPLSKFSLSLNDTKELRRVSADTEQYLRKQYEERKIKADAAVDSRIKPNP